MALFDRIIDPALLVRRINLTAAHVIPEYQVVAEQTMVQMDLFTDTSELLAQEAALKREKRRQKAVLTLQKRYGKNAVIKGMNLLEGATAMDRNQQIGGHKA